MKTSNYLARGKLINKILLWVVNSCGFASFRDFSDVDINFRTWRSQRRFSKIEVYTPYGCFKATHCSLIKVFWESKGFGVVFGPKSLINRCFENFHSIFKKKVFSKGRAHQHPCANNRSRNIPKTSLSNESSHTARGKQKLSSAWVFFRYAFGCVSVNETVPQHKKTVQTDMLTNAFRYPFTEKATNSSKRTVSQQASENGGRWTILSVLEQLQHKPLSRFPRIAMPWRPRRCHISCRRTVGQSSPSGAVGLLAILPQNVHTNAGQPTCIRFPQRRQRISTQRLDPIHVLRWGER